MNILDVWKDAAKAGIMDADDSGLVMLCQIVAKKERQKIIQLCKSLMNDDASDLWNVCLVEVIDKIGKGGTNVG